MTIVYDVSLSVWMNGMHVDSTDSTQKSLTIKQLLINCHSTPFQSPSLDSLSNLLVYHDLTYEQGP